MGLFESKKTSLDYLKEISKESKKQTQATRMAAEAEQNKADAIVEAARERTRAAIRLKDRAERSELSKRINELDFDPANPKGMVSSLSYLCSLIEGWLGSYAAERGHRTLCKAAESKLRMGLKQLTLADPSNNMIPYFNGMMEEFQAKREKIRKHGIIRLAIPWSLFLLAVVAMCIYGFIVDWDDTALAFLLPLLILLFVALGMTINRPPLDRDETD